MARFDWLAPWLPTLRWVRETSGFERKREREREKCKAAKSDKIAKVEKIERNRPRDSFLPGGEEGKVQASEMTAGMIYDSSLFSRLGITSVPG